MSNYAKKAPPKRGPLPRWPQVTGIGHKRHSTACHLLHAGVDINTIRGWLGHVSLDTTNIYAEVDLETKATALAKCEIGDRRTAMETSASFEARSAPSFYSTAQ